MGLGSIPATRSTSSWLSIYLKASLHSKILQLHCHPNPTPPFFIPDDIVHTASPLPVISNDRLQQSGQRMHQRTDGKTDKHHPAQPGNQ